MKILIQHKKSFQYVRSEAEWTDDALKAQNFDRIQSAADFCRKNALSEAYIICGEYNEQAKRLNAATKTVLDVGRLRAQPSQAENALNHAHS